MLAANGAIHPAREAQFLEAHFERIVGQQPSDQRQADAHDELDRLGRLDRAQYAGQYAKYTGLGTVRDHALGHFRKQTAIAGAAARHVGHGLALEAVDRR